MGTISDKLTYLSETKTQLKDMINYGLDTGEKITSETTFRNYVKSLFDAFIKTMTYPDVLYNNLPKVTGEGTSVTLNGTVEAPMKIELSPSALEQKTTSGKNLFNKEATPLYTVRCTLTQIENGLNVTRSGTNYGMAIFEIGNISNFVGKTITIQANYNDYFGGTGLINCDENGNNRTTIATLSGDARQLTTTIGNDYTQSKLAFRVYITTEATADTAYPITDIQVELGNTATSYEPFTYGASPNPQYPQEIHTIGGENTITISNSDNTQNQTYPLSLGDLEYCKIGDYEDGFVRNSGKNLLNRAICDEDKGLVWARGDTFSDTNSLVSNYIKVEANESLSFNYKAQVLFYDSSQNYLGALKISSGSATIIVGTGTYENQITIPNVADVYYMRLGFRTSQNDNIDMTAVDIMVNKGSSLLPYEPYGSGKWYLKKNIGKVVLDGSESDWFNDGGGAPFSVHVPLKGVNNKLMVMSDYFRGVTYSSSWTVYDTLVSTSAAAATNPAIKFRYIGIGGLDDFKTWLSTHNTTVYYVLATQTYTLLSDTLQTQLDNIQKAISYQDQTNVSQTNNDLPFVIKLSAIKNYEEI